MLDKYCMRIMKNLMFCAFHALILDNNYRNLYLTTTTTHAPTSYDVWQASKPGYIHKILKRK